MVFFNQLLLFSILLLDLQKVISIIAKISNIKPRTIPPAWLSYATFFGREFFLRQIKIIKKGRMLAAVEFISTVASILLLLIFPFCP